MILFDEDRAVIIGTNACNFTGCKLHRFPIEHKAKKERFDKYTIFHIDGGCCGYDYKYYTLTHNGKQYIAESLDNFVLSKSVGESDNNLIGRAKTERKKAIALSACALISFVVITTFYLWFINNCGGVYR